MTETDLSLHEQAGVFFPGVEIKKSGLIIESLNKVEWARCGMFLDVIHGATMWWIGDWARYAETTWGNSYQELIEKTGYDYGTLRNAVFVCKAVELSRRRDKLSHAHHAEVAKLDSEDQDKWLAIAEHEKLTHKELRASIKADKVLHEADIPKTESFGFDSIERLPLDFNRIYQKAFADEDITECKNAQRLQTWIASTQPMADANRAARTRLAEIGSGSQAV